MMSVFKWIVGKSYINGNLIAKNIATIFLHS
jgi:hypothetical protein